MNGASVSVSFRSASLGVVRTATCNGASTIATVHDLAARANSALGRPTPNMWMRSPFARTGAAGIDGPPTFDSGRTTRFITA